jgi:hypothetical protein
MHKQLLHHTFIINLFSFYVICVAIGLIGPILANRQQVVMVGKKMSKLKHITAGVPHGSILGPFLF